MNEFQDTKFYKLLQDFFINNDKETFIQFLAEFYNRTEGIINKNNIQDDLIKELRELYIKFSEEGIDENIVREKVNYFVENNVKIQNIFSQLSANDNKIQNINSQIENIETIDLTNNELLLFGSYQSGNFSSVNAFTLYVGDDCEKCYPINNNKIIEFVTGKPLWDIACFYANNKFYFIGDYKDNNEVWGGNSFLLLETEDLINFKQTPFKIRSSTKNITQTWAPKIFKDGERYYLIYCIQENNETYVDTNLLNIEHQKLKLCYSVALDNTFTNWSDPTYFNINSDECYIDPFMYKINGVYHLFACYDNNAEIRHFTSQSLNGRYELKGVVPFPNVTEAPSIIDFNNKFYIFVDSHRATGGRDSGLIQVMESDDLYTWTNLKTYKNTANATMRHFAPLVVKAKEQKEIINNLFKKFKINNNYIDSNNSVLSSEKNNISYFDLASLTPKTTKTIDELYVMPNTIYYMNSYIDTITINKLNASKLKNFDTFSFVLNSFGDSKLTIKNNSDKGGFLPTRKDLIIDGYKGSNLITFTVLDGYIKCYTFMEYVEHKHKFNFVKNGDFKREELTMFGGMNGYTPTLDSSKEYLKIEETSTALWKGVAQDIILQQNKKYRVSAVIFTKDKTLLTDEIGLTIKGVRSIDSQDIELGATYLKPSDIKDYYGKEISFILDTSNITLSDYNRFYVYLFLKKQGCIYVKNIKVEYVE